MCELFTCQPAVDYREGFTSDRGEIVEVLVISNGSGGSGDGGYKQIGLKYTASMKRCG